MEFFGKNGRTEVRV